MYPDWPESAADLVPLPLIDGPKLKAFDFKGSQNIEFLEYLGEGLHAHVVKVRIHGRLYALKLFRFPYDGDWNGGWKPPYPDCPPDPSVGLLPPSDEVKAQARAYFSAFYHYSEPFSCECRAFARLQEAGHEELAVKCYGYILLDEKHEKDLRSKLRDSEGEPMSFDGNFDFPTAVGEQRGRFLGDRSGRPPPIRGILKELGVPTTKNPGLRMQHVKKMLQDIKYLQQLGILHVDPAMRQLIGGKFSDFSTAITTPHYIINPELNPNLSPELGALLENETFRLVVKDYVALEDELQEWNELNEEEEEPQPRIPWDVVFRRAPRMRWPPWQERRELRSIASGKTRFCTFVDPRLYDWKREAQRGSQRSISKHRSTRGGVRRKGCQKPVKLLKRPRWCYETSGVLAARAASSVGGINWLKFDLEEGRMVPLLKCSEYKDIDLRRPPPASPRPRRSPQRGGRFVPFDFIK